MDSHTSKDPLQHVCNVVVFSTAAQTQGGQLTARFDTDAKSCKSHSKPEKPHLWKLLNISRQVRLHPGTNLKDFSIYMGEILNDRWHQHMSVVFFSLRVSVVSRFQWEVQDQRSRWRADIKRISKMNSSFKSLHVGLILTWWGFSCDFDAERIKERRLIDGPVTCSHMKYGGSPWPCKLRSNNDLKKNLLIKLKPLRG